MRLHYVYYCLISLAGLLLSGCDTAQWETQLQRLQSELDETQTALAQAEQRGSQLSETLVAKDRDIAGLNLQIKTATVEQADVGKRLLTDNNTLQQQTVALQSQLDAALTARSQLQADTDAELAALRDELTRTRTNSDTELGALRDELTRTRTNSDTELVVLRDELTRTRTNSDTELVALRDELIALQNQLSTAQDQLQQKDQSQQEASDVSAQQHEQLVEQNHQLSAALGNARIELDNARAELARASGAYDALSGQHRQQQFVIDVANAELGEHRGLLQQSLEKLSATQRLRDSVDLRLSGLVNEREKLNQQFNSARDELDAVRDELDVIHREYGELQIQNAKQTLSLNVANDERREHQTLLQQSFDKVASLQTLESG